MRVEDFKNNPSRYQEIKDICKEFGIQCNDETDILDLIKLVNSHRVTEDIASAANKIRGS